MEISVVIPLYNKKETILRAIESVLGQSYLPQEIIVVNDGSTDGSEQMVSDLNHPMIQLINQENSGVSAARNTGITMARYEWIAFLDADDIWKKNYLHQANLTLKVLPSAKVIGSSYQIINHQNKVRNVVLNGVDTSKHYIFLNNYFKIATKSEPPFNSSSVIIKRKILNQIKGFPEGIIAGEDLLTWARLAIDYKIGYCLHSNSVFYDIPFKYSNGNKVYRFPQKVDYVGKELKDIYSKNKNRDLKNYISKWHNNRLRVLLKNGLKLLCLKEATQAISFNPKNKKNYYYVILPFFPKFLIDRIFPR